MRQYCRGRNEYYVVMCKQRDFLKDILRKNLHGRQSFPVVRFIGAQRFWYNKNKKKHKLFNDIRKPMAIRENWQPFILRGNTRSVHTHDASIGDEGYKHGG